MKKILAMLLFASMILSGCGDNATNDAKQKVENKAEEVKQDAKDTAAQVENKAEEVKQDAKDTAAKVENKANEIQQDAAQTVSNAESAVSQTAMEILDTAKSIFKDSREIPLAGVLPGITLDKLIQAFGEPVSRDGDEVTFSNGMEVELHDNTNNVEKIVIRTPGIATPEGVAVGMNEGILNTAYGPADKVDVDRDDGEVEYKYYSKDNKKSIQFTSHAGIISKIESELRD